MSTHLADLLLPKGAKREGRHQKLLLCTMVTQEAKTIVEVNPNPNPEP